MHTSAREVRDADWSLTNTAVNTLTVLTGSALIARMLGAIGRGS